MSCLYISPRGHIAVAPANHAQLLLIVNGRAEATSPNGMHLNPLAGMGLLLQEGEGCQLASATGAVILTIEASRLWRILAESPSQIASWASSGRVSRATNNYSVARDTCLSSKQVFKWGSSSLLGHVVVCEALFGVPMFLFALTSMHAENTLTISSALRLGILCAVMAAIIAVAFWYSISSNLTKRRK